MKLLFSTGLVALLTALACLPAAAQFNVGIKGGVSYMTTYGSPEEFQGDKLESIRFAPGFQIGIFSDIPCGDVLSFITELNYEQRNGIKDIDVALSPAAGLTVRREVEAKNTFGYVTLPILVALGGENFKVYAGPNLGFLLHARSQQTITTSITPEEAAGSPGLPTPGTVETEIDFVNDDPYADNDPYINRFALGANAGVRLGFGDLLFLDLRVYHSLIDVTNNDYDRSLIDSSPREDNDKTAGAQLSLGWKF